jgi:hypothetical protein
MILGAAAYRLAPHPYNIAPLGAMALVGGLYFGRRYALWVPLIALAATDLILNQQAGYPVLYWPRAFDYSAFLLIGALGLWARQRSFGTKLGSVAATPFMFYLISNFGVWLFGLNLANQFYPKTVTGLTECYVAGLPFLRGTMIGDWAFVAAFGVAMVAAKSTAGARASWLTAEAKA